MQVVTFTADLGQGEELEPARKKVGCPCSCFTDQRSEGLVALLRGACAGPQEGGLRLRHWLVLLEAAGVTALLRQRQPPHEERKKERIRQWAWVEGASWLLSPEGTSRPPWQPRACSRLSPPSLA